jgi:uncharacterized protein YjbJ (UPF0337 family)
MWNKDEVKGKGKQVKGTIKEKVGQATNDPNLQDEGRAERAEGDVEETVGKVRRKAGEAVQKVGKAISR